MKKTNVKKAAAKNNNAGLKQKMEFVVKTFAMKHKPKVDAVKALITKYGVGLNYARNIVYFRLAKVKW